MALSATNIHKSFFARPVLRGVEESVHPGEVLVLLGPNGAGKTTFLRLLAGILHPDAGQILMDGMETRYLPHKGRGRLGMIAEEPGHYDRLTLRSMLTFFARLFEVDPAASYKRLEPIIARLGLAEHADDPLGTYSKGMAQKASFLRALVHDPPYLLYDEPTSSLDPASALAVRRTIRDLARRGKGILVCTHNLAEAEFVGDRMTIMVRGRFTLRTDARGFREILGRKIRYDFLLSKRIANAEKIEPLLREALADSLNDLSINDETITVSSNDPSVTHPKIIALLGGDGYSVVSVAPAPGELESAYLALIEEHHTAGDEG